MLIIICRTSFFARSTDVEKLTHVPPRFDICRYNAGMDPFGGGSIGGMQGVTQKVLRDREVAVFSWCRMRGAPGSILRQIKAAKNKSRYSCVQGETVMRNAILTLGFVMGTAAVALAVPLAPAPDSPNTVVLVHGCHHYYAQDMSGWHRHDKNCNRIRSLSRNNRS